MFGTTATGKGMFGGGNPPWTANPPAFPQLDWFHSNSWLGVPFYHFMADWDQSTASGRINLEKLESYDITGQGGGVGPIYSSPPEEARVGDYVWKWKNTWLPEGEGEAIVTEGFHSVGSHTGGSGGSHTFFGFLSYPTLVAREYNGRAFKGLQFTGTEFLTIKGSTVTESPNMATLPGPLFTTSGASWTQPEVKGATFIMVIDQDPYRPPHGWQQERTSQVQSLLYSRSPGYLDDPQTGSDWMENGSQIPGYWPDSEYMGVQYFRNIRPQADGMDKSAQAFGPNGTTIGTDLSISQGPDTGNNTYWANVSEFIARPPAAGHLLPNMTETLNDDYGGSDWRGDNALNPGSNHAWDRPYNLRSSPEFDLHGPLSVHRTHEGFQVILLEYDNVNQIKYEKDPIPSQHEWGAYRDLYERDYTGPAMKIYGMSSHYMSSWRGLDLTYPKLWDTHPALANHTLFDKKELQLGGLHPYHHQSLEWGNGFRGVIFEVLMLEGILSPADKHKLQEYFIEKYAGALMPGGEHK